MKFINILLILVLCVTPAFAKGPKGGSAAGDLQAEVDQLKAELDTLKGELQTLQNGLPALNTAKNNANTDQQNAQTAKNAAQTAYDAAKAASDAAPGDKDLKDAKDDAQDDLNVANTTLNNANTALTNATNAVNTRNSDITTKQGQVNAKQTEYNNKKALLNAEPVKFEQEFQNFLGDVSAFNEEVDKVEKHLKDRTNEYLDKDPADQNVQAQYEGKSGAYFAEAKNKFNAMQGVFNANNGKAGIDNVSKNYEEEMGNFFKFYMNDLVDHPTNEDGSPRYAFQDYMDDFGYLNDSFQQDVDRLGFDAGSDAKDDRIKDPREMLDKDVEHLIHGAVKIELGWVGVENKGLSGANLYDIITKNGKLGGGGKTSFDDATNWFKDSWQSQENAMMDLPVKNTAAVYDAGNNGGGFSGDKSWIVNAYGQIVPSNEAASYANDLGDAGESLTSYVSNERYNNRSYGYKYSNGTYNVAKVTVGKKQYVLQHTVFTSPIVLDMDGDGKLEASGGKWLPHTELNNSRIVEFDINGDGFLELIEWVGSNDGLLLSSYEKGKEVTGNNLFGEAGGWAHGFEKMSLLDTNQDRQLSGDELATLSVWQDKNGNASVDEGEINSVKDLGITSISVEHNQLQSSFTQNDEVKSLWDWYPVTLQVKRAQ
jgi:hypothetical protein